MEEEENKGEKICEEDDIINDDNDLSGNATTTPLKTTKIYQTRGRRKSSSFKLKPPLKTPKKKQGQTSTITKGPTTAKQELAELREENTTLNNAMKLLQETVIQQGNLITDLSARVDKVSQDNLKEYDEKLRNLETRIVNFYTDQDKKCSAKKKQVTSSFNAKMDKISNKLDNALRNFTDTINNAPAPPSDGVHLNDLQTRVKNLSINVEKVEHEMAKMQDSIDKLADDDTPFSPVSCTRSRNNYDTNDNDNISNYNSNTYERIIEVSKRNSNSLSRTFGNEC